MTRHIKLSGPTTESTPLFPNLFGQHLSKHESVLLDHKAVAWILGFDNLHHPPFLQRRVHAAPTLV